MDSSFSSWLRVELHSATGPSPAQRRTLLITGLAYAGLAVTGLVGYLAIRSQLYVAGDAATTAAHLVSHEGLARVGGAIDLAAVLTQAVAAVWFFRLFRTLDSFAAGLIAAFGLVNSVVMLVGASLSVTALDVAIGNAANGTGERASTALLMYDLSEAVWGAGAVFFGLWLIPMGWCALRSRFIPPLLGRLLIVGGIGYVLSAFVGVLVEHPSTVAYVLTVPATIGELWMVGYLLIAGRPAPRRPDRAAAMQGGDRVSSRRPRLDGAGHTRDRALGGTR